MDDFRQLVYVHYDAHGRHELPWRQAKLGDDFDPYKIMVSELMLQQTQVSRVIPKFQAFLKAFPTVQALAGAEFGDVLRVWSGLGYNRRAKFLWQAAQAVMTEFDGTFPQTVAELVSLPGVGVNTAGAIRAYAFNEPVVFIETNIRTVFIHHFFDDQTNIADKAIIELVTETLDREQPREWYWALMDYGAFLKATVGNLSRQSKTYIKQSTFHGSRRQVRGQVLRVLAAGPQTLAELQTSLPDERLSAVLSDLESESLIKLAAGKYRL